MVKLDNEIIDIELEEEKVKEYLKNDEEVSRLLSDKIEEKEKERKKLSEKEEELKNKENSLRDKLTHDADTSEIRKIADDIDNLKNEIIDIKETIDSLNSELDDITSAKKKAEETRDSYREKISSTIDSFAESIEAIENAARICKNENLKKALEEEIERKKEKLDKLKNERNIELNEIKESAIKEFKDQKEEVELNEVNLASLEEIGITDASENSDFDFSSSTESSNDSEYYNNETNTHQDHNNFLDSFNIDDILENINQNIEPESSEQNDLELNQNNVSEIDEQNEINQIPNFENPDIDMNAPNAEENNENVAMDILSDLNLSSDSVIENQIGEPVVPLINEEPVISDIPSVDGIVSNDDQLAPSIDLDSILNNINASTQFSVEPDGNPILENTVENSVINEQPVFSGLKITSQNVVNDSQLSEIFSSRGVMPNILTYLEKVGA